MDFSSGGSVIMDYGYYSVFGQKQQFKVKTS